MKKFTFVLILALIANFMLISAAFADVSEQDVKEAIKITEKLRKLSDRNDIEGIKKYYSDNYKSHDGYNKDQIMEIFETARKLIDRIAGNGWMIPRDIIPAEYKGE